MSEWSINEQQAMRQKSMRPALITGLVIMTLVLLMVVATTQAYFLGWGKGFDDGISTCKVDTMYEYENKGPKAFNPPHTRNNIAWQFPWDKSNEKLYLDLNTIQTIYLSDCYAEAGKATTAECHAVVEFIAMSAAPVERALTLRAHITVEEPQK